MKTLQLMSYGLFLKISLTFDENKLRIKYMESKEDFFCWNKLLVKLHSRDMIKKHIE